MDSFVVKRVKRCMPATFYFSLPVPLFLKICRNCFRLCQSRSHLQVVVAPLMYRSKPVSLQQAVAGDRDTVFKMLQRWSASESPRLTKLHQSRLSARWSQSYPSCRPSLCSPLFWSGRGRSCSSRGRPRPEGRDFSRVLSVPLWSPCLSGARVRLRSVAVWVAGSPSTQSSQTGSWTGTRRTGSPSVVCRGWVTSHSRSGSLRPGVRSRCHPSHSSAQQGQPEHWCAAGGQPLAQASDWPHALQCSREFCSLLSAAQGDLFWLFPSRQPHQEASQRQVSQHPQ